MTDIAYAPKLLAENEALKVLVGEMAEVLKETYGDMEMAGSFKAGIMEGVYPLNDSSFQRIENALAKYKAWKEKQDE